MEKSGVLVPYNLFEIEKFVVDGTFLTFIEEFQKQNRVLDKDVII
jgi:hypothetical protein